MLSASISIFPREPQGEISPFLHGQFLEHTGDCIYPGVWVGPESDIPHRNGLRLGVLEALKDLAPPVVRWPGGCFADAYDWRDGIGANRPHRVTTRWGNDEIETNEFGSHEFLEFCRDIGAKPWLSGNVGSGTPRELAQWVEYCNFGGDSTLARVRAQNGQEAPFGVEFWGIGNESWDCGGKMTPATYAAHYRQFESIFPRFSGQKPFLIAVGPDGGSSANNAKWTRQLMQELEQWHAPQLDGIDAHFYNGNGQNEFGSATEFSLDEYYGLLAENLKIGALIDQQREILDSFALGRGAKLILGEWGIWHAPDERFFWQPNTLRDAISAAMTLDLLHLKSQKVWMANLAQGVNVLQSLLHTFGDQTVQTPTFHVFNLYKRHRGGQLLQADFESGEAGGLPRLSGSASLQNGVVTLSVVNSGAKSPVEATISLPGQKIEVVAAKELSGDGLAAQNTLETPDALAPREIAPNFDAVVDASSFSHTFAPASVTVFLIQLA
jgi:alpha-N-arabinofuranosidase